MPWTGSTPQRDNARLTAAASWDDSLRHGAIRHNHRRMVARAWARQRAIWQSDGPFLTADNCRPGPPAPPRRQVAAWNARPEPAPTPEQLRWLHEDARRRAAERQGAGER